jgi:concentrative nucleoside transporter, CNT family
MDLRLNIISLIGVYAFCFLAWTLSSDKKNIPWNTIKWGLGTQFFLSFLFLSFPFFFSIFSHLVSFFSYFYTIPFGYGSIKDFSSLDILFSIYKDTGSFHSYVSLLFIGILFLGFSYTKVYKKIIPILGKLFEKTFVISGKEAIISLMSPLFGIESLFIGGMIYKISPSKLFTIVNVLLSSSSTLLIIIHSDTMGNIIPNTKGHLFFASLLSVFSAIIVSKIIFPYNQSKEPTEVKITEPSLTLDTFWKGSITVSKFLGGAMLGGFILICITNLIDGTFQILGSFREIKVGPNDLWYIALFKYIKIGISEVFIKLSLKNLIAILLFPLCFLAGVSLEMVELWRVSLLYSTNILGGAMRFSDSIPLIKENIYSDRSILLSIYLINSSFSIGAIGMVFGGFFMLLEEKPKQFSVILIKIFPAGILSQFITIAVVGVFDFGNPLLFGRL